MWLFFFFQKYGAQAAFGEMVSGDPACQTSSHDCDIELILHD
jgi:hypothetical protein